MGAPLRSRTWLERAGLGALLVLAAVLLFAPRDSADLQFDPSAYTAQSDGLLQGRGNTIRLGDEVLPGFYPPGYPLALVPVHWVLGFHPQNGVFASLGFALLTVLLVYFLGRRLAGPAAGAVAALVLLGNELFGQVAQSILTQSQALCIVALVAHLALGSPGGRRARSWAFAAGLLAGLSLLVRYQNFILAGGVGLWALVASSGDLRSRLRSVAPLGAGIAVGGAVVMLYCTIAYGSPLRTGYHLWDFPFEGSFALDHLFHPKLFEGSDKGPWLLVRCLFGLGPLYPWPVALLWLAGTAVAWRQRRTDPVLARAGLLAAVLNAVLFLILGLYVFRSPKYAMLGLPLIAAMAGVGAVWWFRGRRLGPLPATAVPVALALLFLVGPVQRSWALGEGRHKPLAREQVVIQGADANLEEDTVVLGYADPILTNVVFVRGTERRYLYLDVRPMILTPLREQARAEVGAAAVTPETVAAYVQRHLSDDDPVYFLLPSPGNGADVNEVLKLRAFLTERFAFESTAVPEIEVIRARPR